MFILTYRVVFHKPLNNELNIETNENIFVHLPSFSPIVVEMARQNFLSGLVSLYQHYKLTHVGAIKSVKLIDISHDPNIKPL